MNQKPDCEDVHEPLLHALPGPCSPPKALLESAGSPPAYDPTESLSVMCCVQSKTPEQGYSANMYCRLY